MIKEKNCDNCGVKNKGFIICFRCFKGSNWIPKREDKCEIVIDKNGNGQGK